MSTHPFEIGLFTFGEITADPLTGRPIDPAVRLREFIELAKIGDQAGLDVLVVERAVEHDADVSQLAEVGHPLLGPWERLDVVGPPEPGLQHHVADADLANVEAAAMSIAIRSSHLHVRRVERPHHVGHRLLLPTLVNRRARSP
jgi:hypothetical protein